VSRRPQKQVYVIQYMNKRVSPMNVCMNVFKCMCMCMYGRIHGSEEKTGVPCVLCMCECVVYYACIMCFTVYVRMKCVVVNMSVYVCMYVCMEGFVPKIMGVLCIMHV
jgi:hypothetical protein